MPSDLDLRPLLAPSTGLQGRSSAARDRRSLPQERLRLPRRRVLLVENNTFMAVLLTDLLADLGCQVCETAATESGAVLAAAKHLPDLMIVDVQLQSGNGVSAMRTILQIKPMPHFFITGSPHRMTPSDAIVLRKPFGQACLEHALAQLAQP